MLMLKYISKPLLMIYIYKLLINDITRLLFINPINPTYLYLAYQPCLCMVVCCSSKKPARVILSVKNFSPGFSPFSPLSPSPHPEIPFSRSCLGWANFHKPYQVIKYDRNKIPNIFTPATIRNGFLIKCQEAKP